MSNSKNEKCELLLKYQAEMDPSVLIESESTPNMALKKIGHELDIAETKCSTLKSELNYMMGVCQKAEIRRSKGTLETSQELITSSKNSKCSAIQRDYTLSSSRSVQFLPRNITDDDNDDVITDAEKTADLKEEKQKGLNVTITPRAQLDKQFSVTMPIPKKQFVRYTEQADGEYENLLSCYPEEHLRSALNIEDSIEELTSKPDEDYFHVMSTVTRRDLVGGPELNLEISDSAKAKRMEKGKHAPRIGKRDTSSFYKTSDATISKRKRRGKLRSSVSKSTIVTRNASSIGKKETKKRKHRGQGAVRQQSNFPKQPNRSSVVEIFHNTTLKSNSGVSGKYSKLDGQVKKHFIKPVNKKFQEVPFSKHVNHEFHDKKDQQNNRQALNYPNDFKESRSPSSPLNVQQKNKLKNHSNEPCLSTQSKTQQCEQAVFNKCNDPTLTPNYEMSTLASRLKRSNRSFFSRYSFQNIPFVVGTSVTPSHNLGLNIQQVLSVMKTRQPIAHSITPLFIRKVSRGMKPMSIFLEQMNEHDKSFFDTSPQINGLINNRENSGDYQRDKKLPVLDLQYAGQEQNARAPNIRADNMKILSRENICGQFQEKNDENHKSTQQSLAAINKRNVSASMSNQRKTSKLSLNKEDNIGDYKIRIPGSHNSKEIRDILINLHDQFEKMNTKYEKLQSELKKTSNDVSLTKELSALEKELNVKEEEISAVIGLYKEVMILKQQMKMLHEKNSFVCIESPKTFHRNSFPISIVRDKCQLMNPTQIFERKACNAIRKPPVSMQLTALLRQIQAFHKQLQVIS